MWTIRREAVLRPMARPVAVLRRATGSIRRHANLHLASTRRLRRAAARVEVQRSPARERRRSDRTRRRLARRSGRSHLALPVRSLGRDAVLRQLPQDRRFPRRLSVPRLTGVVAGAKHLSMSGALPPARKFRWPILVVLDGSGDESSMLDLKIGVAQRLNLMQRSEPSSDPPTDGPGFNSFFVHALADLHTAGLIEADEQGRLWITEEGSAGLRDRCGGTPRDRRGAARRCRRRAAPGSPEAHPPGLLLRPSSNPGTSEWADRLTPRGDQSQVFQHVDRHHVAVRRVSVLLVVRLVVVLGRVERGRGEDLRRDRASEPRLRTVA